MFAFGSWQGTAGFQRLELTVANVGTTGYHCKELPVPRGWNSWFPTWEPWVTIASNCRLPEVGNGSQRGNQRLPLHSTVQRLELLVPNLGTRGYHCKELPEVGTHASNLGTIGYHCKELPFLKVGTDGSQRGNQRLPWQGTAGSQTLKLTVPNLGTRGYHCKELPVPRS